MSEKLVKCGNPGCENMGQKRCSACATVIYCSSECQKKHWSAHKANCKKPATDVTTTNAPASEPTSPNTTTIPIDKELVAKLQAEKHEVHRSFTVGDFASAIQHTKEAIVLAKELPFVAAVAELVQLHVNASSAFAQMNDIAECENFASEAVRIAEQGAIERKNHPQSIELLTVALNSKVTALLTAKKYDPALQTASRAAQLAESIYPKNDPRLYKSLRTLASATEKASNDVIEAEKIYLKAYTILSLSVGPQIPEAQMTIDDIVNMFLRRNDLDSAEKYARMAYKTLQEKYNGTTTTTTESEQSTTTGQASHPANSPPVIAGAYADASSRLATILVKKGQRTGSEEAEGLLSSALQLRQNKIPNANELSIALNLSQLCAVRDALNMESDNIEQMLKQSLEIFSRLKGPNSGEVMNTLSQLKAYMAKKQGKVSSSSSSGGGSKGRVEELDSEDESEDLALASGSGSGSGSKATVPSSSSSGSTIDRMKALQANQLQLSQVTTDDRMKLQALDGKPADMLMAVAQYFAQQAKFTCAEVVYNKAYQAFLKEQNNNEEHPGTLAAKQNCVVSKHNRVRQLWLEAVTEEVIKIEEQRGQPQELGSNGDDELMKILKGSSTSKTNTNNNNELSLEEKLFLSSADEDDLRKKETSCIVC